MKADRIDETTYKSNEKARPSRTNDDEVVREQGESEVCPNQNPRTSNWKQPRPVFETANKPPQDPRQQQG